MFNTLIVEDSNDFRQVLMDILQVEFPSMKVTGAKSAEQALKKVEKRTPDLVFVDIKLPGISGLDLAKRLRATFPRIVIVVLTSYDVPEYREAATKNKIDHFLLKGKSTRAEIVALVKSILADRPAV
jgi:two-component system response regulator YesN